MIDEHESLGVLIMAAGKGTRMHSETPKVLQTILEEPMLCCILDAVRGAGVSDTAVLVGHKGDMVADYVRGHYPDVEIIWQREQLGTAHAVSSARGWWERFDSLLVLNGDIPLVRSSTIASLVRRHTRRHVECTMISVDLDDPTGYGRVIRIADGGIRIVEQRDAGEDELEINEINAGVYIFDTHALADALKQVEPNNEKGEYYLTDTIRLIHEAGGEIDVVHSEDGEELLGVNSPVELADAARALNARILHGHMTNGLKCLDPASTWIGPRVKIGLDVTIEPGVQIWGACEIGDGCRIGAHSTIRDSVLGARVTVAGPSVIVGSRAGDESEIGPFAYLRDGASLGQGARAGRFVEIKNSELGCGAKVPHLSYIGDAAIGARTNIGAGTITCNYDGRDKHRTTIGDDCRIGSDTMLVAPVTVGDGAYTGAGSVITKDVPPGALGLGRARQTNLEDWPGPKTRGR